jgi:hypothetical protein
MKSMVAVTLLILSLASAAFADGPGTAPPPVKRKLFAVIQLADGSGGAPPPVKFIKPLTTAAIRVADGSGGAPPPIKPLKPAKWSFAA